LILFLHCIVTFRLLNTLLLLDLSLHLDSFEARIKILHHLLFFDRFIVQLILSLLKFLVGDLVREHLMLFSFHLGEVFTSYLLL